MDVVNRLLKVGLFVVLVGLCTVAPAMEVNINFLLGGKGLEEDDWGESAIGVDAESQVAFGIETTFGGREWPVAIALDSVGSMHYEDLLVVSPVPATVELVQGTQEFDFGVRKIWKPGAVRPFVGGGLGLMSARQEVYSGLGVLTLKDDDTTLGFWVNGGVFWRLGPKFNIGVDLRLSSGTVELFGQDVHTGGATFGLILGWGWGGGDR
jgi:hypothetical protein